MKRLLLAVLAALGLTTPAFAGPMDCPAIPGMIVGGASTSMPPCYQLIINSDGSINVKSTGAGGTFTTVPSDATSTNGASTITAGGTFQTISTATPARKSFEFQNICGKSGNCVATSDLCYLHWPAGSPTTGVSLTLRPGDYYGRMGGVVPNDAIEATCDGTADKFWMETQ